MSFCYNEREREREREKQKFIFVSERASYNGEAMLYYFKPFNKIIKNPSSAIRMIFS